MRKQVLLWGVCLCLGVSAVASTTDAQPNVAAGGIEPSSPTQPDAQGSAGSSSEPAPAPGQAGAPANVQSASEVRLQDSAVFSIHIGFGAQSAEERARAASQALLEAVNAGASEAVRVEHVAGAAVIYADKLPIVQLFPDDARLENEVSFEAYCARIATRIKEAIIAERRRRAVAQTVFSLSLVVFLGLIALYLLKKSGDVAERARAWVEANPDRVPALQIRSLQLIGAGPLNTIVILAISVAKWLWRVVVLYAYLLIVSSMFEATRGFAEKLTGFVLVPISDLMGRLAMTVPTLIVLALAAVVVLVLVRFAGLFFASVESGDTELDWLPPELAAPTSVLSRIAIVVLALVFAAPLITGDASGSLAKLSTFVLLALALAVTPILANVVVGIGVVFRRQLRVGDTLEIGTHKGRLLRIGLMEMVIEDAEGGEAHIPYLWQLVRPFRVFRAKGEHR